MRHEGLWETYIFEKHWEVIGCVELLQMPIGMKINCVLFCSVQCTTNSAGNESFTRNRNKLLLLCFSVKRVRSFYMYSIYANDIKKKECTNMSQWIKIYAYCPINFCDCHISALETPNKLFILEKKLSISRMVFFCVYALGGGFFLDLWVYDKSARLSWWLTRKIEKFHAFF